MATVVIAVSATATLLVFQQSVMTPGRPEPVEIIAAAVRAQGPELPFCACGALGRSLNFYTHAPVLIADVTPENVDQAVGFMDTPSRVLEVLDARELAVVEARKGTRFPRIAEVTYLNTSIWQHGEVLLRPDPSWMQHVVLIASR
jgi:hypothetical protein